jgi:uncharacterized protein (DUF983 family)
MNNPDTNLPMWPAVVLAKCPRCRRGPMFLNQMYGLKPQTMNKTCPHCGLIYEREPGYFYVAMLLSYAMFVAEMITLAVAINVLTGSANPWLYVIIIISIGLVLSPFNFRYSRVTLLHWFTPGLHYKPELSRDNKETSTLR